MDSTVLTSGLYHDHRYNLIHLHRMSQPKMHTLTECFEKHRSSIFFLNIQDSGGGEPRNQIPLYQFLLPGEKRNQLQFSPFQASQKMLPAQSVQPNSSIAGSILLLHHLIHLPK